MSEILRSPDQLAKINALYTKVYAFVKEGLAKGKTPVERLKIYMSSEGFGFAELTAVFQELSFLSPNEKRMLVRMALAEVVAGQEVALVEPPKTDVAGSPIREEAKGRTTYHPPQFNLNINKVANDAPIPAEPQQEPTPLRVVNSKPRIATTESHLGE